MKNIQTLSFINSSINIPEEMEVMDHVKMVRLLGCMVPKWIFGLPYLMDLELQYNNSQSLLQSIFFYNQTSFARASAPMLLLLQELMGQR